MTTLADLKIKLFADGADKRTMLELYRDPTIQGFTTNPSLLRKAGVADYRGFAAELVKAIPDRPISFEVIADELDEMEYQARQIASWGQNVYVKIPVTNSRGESTASVVAHLARAGVQVNVTAVFTLRQVRQMASAIADRAPGVISVFAGRIADTGLDPVPLMSAAKALLEDYPNLELLWASPREVLNVVQADSVGCHIITATTDLLKKLGLLGKDLNEFSLETVRMFLEDARAVGLVFPTRISRAA